MSPQSAPFSCALIGGDTLLIQCGEVLRARGHRIVGVVTSAPRIAAWARGVGLRVIDARPGYGAELAAEPFDHLFSITHLALIPEDVLRLPRRGAINFHDGPLPDYAGLFTPAWALLRGAQRYGVTWHAIEAGIDEGSILAQQMFDLSDEETSLSLNTRCFEAGLTAFGELVDQLAVGRVERTPQDLTRREYFGKHARPSGGGVLDWQRPAAELHALVRALDFGPYPNQFAAAKVLHRGTAVLVTRVELEAAEAAPGTLLEVGAASLVVAAGEGALRITGFSDLDGRELTASAACAHLGVTQGDTLTLLDTADRARLDEVATAASRGEARWARLLPRIEGLELPWASAPDGRPARHRRVEVQLPPAFGASGTDEAALTASVVAAFGALLARLTGRDRLLIGFDHAGLHTLRRGVEPLLAERALLDLAPPRAKAFEALQADTADELARATRAGTWLHDLVARTPALHGHAAAKTASELDVNVVLTRGISEDFTRARDLVTLAIDSEARHVAIVVDSNRVPDHAVRRLVFGLEALLARAASAPAEPLASADILAPDELARVVHGWNSTDAPYPTDTCVHTLIQRQAARTPERVAVVFEDSTLTYRELDRRARALATHLVERGVTPGALVGVHVERSLDLVVAVLGVLYAGGAYVPLDPAFPRDRIVYMIEDSGLQLVLTQRPLVPSLSVARERLIVVDEPLPPATETLREAAPSAPKDLAYVIYTSGSTGKPKGVMVEHQSVVNFFTGMDARIAPEPPGSWLAVTSLSFDISVLELLWTLSRGFELVVHLDHARKGEAAPAHAARKMDFGLFLWGNDAGAGARKYELMLAAARFGDTHGFSSIWTPERHFHAFGGPFPNPSVTSAAIAAITERIHIRAGSCVSPLHHPLRIAEEWAVVDNLSNGRVGISFASGWQPDDFVLRPEGFADNKGQMVRDIDTVRRLWRGEELSFPGPKGEVKRAPLPRPVQAELPVWVTTAGNPDTYRLAGETGANVLTHLLGQSVKEVAEKIGVYRAARAAAGLDPSTGIVTLMLHTFIGDDLEAIREVVRGPMKRYLASATNLVKKYAWSFPAFRRPDAAKVALDDLDLDGLSEDEWDAMMEHAFQRYFESSGLFGTPESVQPMIDELKAIGVDEIGCLVDYGIENSLVIEQFAHLDRARQLANKGVGAASARSLRDQVQRRKVTHLQCTPSMARMLLLDEENHGAFTALKELMIGGEAFPPVLARDLQAATSARITNMYGPTETTIWSSTHVVEPGATTIPIGRPIANTRMYVLDDGGRPLPPGVAGHLFIGGGGVVRGYLNRPELTAERFVADPFHPGARMYATGDVARWREDGVLEFLGRSDHQVKIRGYRIELGEIEALLDAHPSVRESVAIVRTDKPDDQRIVAYLTSDGPPPDAAVLREYLRGKLPEYMVPAHFVVLDSLPLTPNAKVDRKALPAPEALAPTCAVSVTAVEPEGELEDTIARCWREVLGLERVGAKDNFFDIGGHSLLAVRLHRLLRETLERPLALTDLYRFPTVHSLASWLDSAGTAAASTKGVDRAQQRREALAQRRKRGTLG
jgi:natural product biosynthesis luciferase-like monooxygenase protein